MSKKKPLNLTNQSCSRKMKPKRWSKSSSKRKPKKETSQLNMTGTSIEIYPSSSLREISTVNNLKFSCHNNKMCLFSIQDLKMETWEKLRRWITLSTIFGLKMILTLKAIPNGTTLKSSTKTSLSGQTRSPTRSNSVSWISPRHRVSTRLAWSHVSGRSEKTKPMGLNGLEAARKSHILKMISLGIQRLKEHLMAACKVTRITTTRSFTTLMELERVQITTTPSASNTSLSQTLMKSFGLLMLSHQPIQTCKKVLLNLETRPIISLIWKWIYFAWLLPRIQCPS